MIRHSVAGCTGSVRTSTVRTLPGNSPAGSARAAVATLGDFPSRFLVDGPTSRRLLQDPRKTSPLEHNALSNTLETRKQLVNSQLFPGRPHRAPASCQQAIKGPDGTLNQKKLPIPGISVRGSTISPPASRTRPSASFKSSTRT